MSTTATPKVHNDDDHHQHYLILIHGAWAGAWVWDAVQPHLVTAGFQVVAVDLPGNSRGEIPPQNVTLDLYTTYIKDKIRVIQQEKHGKECKISLIAHSGAGIIALQVAHDLGGGTAVGAAAAPPPALHSLVIVAGMMLPSGLTYPEFRATLPADLQVEPLDIQFSDDGLSSTVSEQAALKCFFQDWPDKEAAIAAARKLTAQPTGGLAIAAHYNDDHENSNSACRIIPKLYIEATQDASVQLPVQRAMQKVFAGQNLHVVSMDTGHVPHVVQPQEFCRLVSEFMASLE